jgi:LPXTG-motif cell wall-anchored protein
MIELLRNVRLIGPEDPNNRGVTARQAMPLILVVIGVVVAIAGLVVGETAGVWTAVIGVVLILAGLVAAMRKRA